MNEYRVQRLKEELTFAQQRNRHQKKQLANYKKVHEKDLKEIERLNYIINELEKWLEEQYQFIIEIPAFTKEISQEHKTMEICYEIILDKIKELKGSNSNE